MIGKNQCVHGSLARSCQICELEQKLAMAVETLEAIYFCDKTASMQIHCVECKRNVQTALEKLK